MKSQTRTFHLKPTPIFVIRPFVIRSGILGIWSLEFESWIFLMAHPPVKNGGSGFTFQVLAPEKRRCGLSSPIPCAPAPCPSPGLLINIPFHPPHIFHFPLPVQTQRAMSLPHPPPVETQNFASLLLHRSAKAVP